MSNLRRRFSKRDTSWVCKRTNCGIENDKDRILCRSCGKSKKTTYRVGRDLAQSSGGLFSPTDWICKSCGNINWAKRISCNLCNKSRDDLLDEIRTGAGGGYNERDIVEYVKNSDSDNEYDEYGRIKKRKKLGKNANYQRIKQESLRDDDDDDMDSQSSAEDVDKYDLSAFLKSEQTAEGL
uniref:Zinc finger Ran-binding domain-containing protein 2 n=1 Tax=Rhodnius prolixus TaxID=13249 RepID=T1IEV8_RHOPR